MFRGNKRYRIRIWDPIGKQGKDLEIGEKYIIKLRRRQTKVKILELTLKGKNQNNASVLCLTMSGKTMTYKAHRFFKAMKTQYM